MYYTGKSPELTISAVFDLTPLYPDYFKPTWMKDLMTWYIATYKDQNFISPQPWFTACRWMELFYHAPLSLWAVRAIWRDNPNLPIHLLVFAVQTAVTTFICIVDFVSWDVITTDEKVQIGTLYGPYLLLAVLMGLDMLGRLKKTTGALMGKSRALKNR
ncbi:hypothetical protein EJ05DRAFT_471924 [Pseudovirgaria hyperparasitica]|uniref:Efficient mitochondria targeting-associated protein 19 n=1 Tax=Pseudovirgaria hyperparasitica TaxID=470096 RepID=A0A6A6WL77_9PEZI|nr:uncharacterized protein EJ05DRAFT_471924 [Pseudovirgaria hyperparasitica]KAF2762964.1 hypothetical protein EJ05DRAFT_471924 [Pseudovirgaria hyperparasitica]